MKRTLSLLLGLSLFGAAAVVAQEAKKDAPKKDAPKKAAAPAVKLPVQPADVAAPKLGNDGQVNPGFAQSHKNFVAIAQKGEILLERAYGHADQVRGVELTTRHRFRVASHSKSFTAAGIMKLRERGKQIGRAHV